MKKYSVRQFIIFQVKEGYAIQNECGFTVVKHKKIIDFFLNLDRENRLEVSKSYLEKYFGDETDDIAIFLQDSKLIEEVKEKELFKKMIIYTNDETIQEGLRFFTQQNAELYEVHYSESIKEEIAGLDEKNVKNADLIFVVLNPFDYRDFVEICDRLQGMDAYNVVCFSYNSTFYMSNLHKREWYNPCPKCFFSHIEMSLRSKSKITDNATFQTIVDLIYNKEVSFKVELPTRYDNIIALLNEIINYRNEDINYLANRVSTISLCGKVEYDQCSHWELCDCFE